MKRHIKIDWSTGFFRVVQVIGLCEGVYELAVRRGGAQLSGLCYSGAMILGPAGLKMFLRIGAEVLHGAADQIEEADGDHHDT